MSPSRTTTTDRLRHADLPGRARRPGTRCPAAGSEPARSSPRSGRAPSPPAGPGTWARPRRPGSGPRWRAGGHTASRPGAALARHAAGGIRLICPGEPGWPPQLDDLGAARPCALWVRGAADLRASCEKSLAVVGARAATAYGRHAATSAARAGRGWAIVSGGAYGIDAAAHHGALTAGGVTIAVLACGPDLPYPRAHAGLLADIAVRGAVISECPPGRQPSRRRFLARNRIIAALARGTVIIEAAERSGTLATARHASELGRPLMAVPGPGHLRDVGRLPRPHPRARRCCVTSAADAASSLPAGTGPGRWPGLRVSGVFHGSDGLGRSAVQAPCIRRW